MNKPIAIFISVISLGITLLSCNNNLDIKIDGDTAGDRDNAGTDNTIDVPQTVEERITDIRNWYSEMVGMSKRNCRIKTRTAYEGFAMDSEKMPFEQKATVCTLSDEYELIEGELSGWEWGSTIHMYKKNGKIFFVFIEGGAESYTFERRYYCDKDENVIRFLERESDDGSQPTGPQMTKPLQQSATNIRDYIKEDLKEIEKILKEEI
jgi:hypothetical protein